MLQNFVDVRLRKFRAACPALEIEFFTGDVRVRGQQVEFSEKERALLFTVAATRTISPEVLADALWPDSDGDAALNALKVCLHRLRRRAGDPRVVRRIGQAYSLHPGADVDLWRLDIVPSGAEPADLTAMREAFGTGTQKRATLGPWFSQFETLLARKLEEIEQSVASKSSGASAVMR
jgi:DNA-binding SARP family transcriptional activator